jgi:aspartate/methionine/tyrosine aminotransferase
MPIEAESPEQFGYDRIRYNLAESSVSDGRLGDIAAGADLDGLVLNYGDHLGHPGLRGLIAAGVDGATADDVLVTPGAAAALFFVHTALLEAGDHVIVARPNYATNVETPRAIGADVSYLELRFEDGWRVDPARIAAMLTARTRLVSLTSPHNPTGQVMDEATLREIVRLVERSGARLLFDETYRDMTFGGPIAAAASLSERAISVSSVSKTYGLPGLRTGWLVARDRDLRDLLLAAKEQVVITGSVVDEGLTFRALSRAATWLPTIMSRIAMAFETTRAWIASDPRFEWVEPTGGVVGFPRIRSVAAVDLDRFYDVLMERYGTVVGPGHWFEQPRSYFRLGFGWPTQDQLAGGLAGLSAALTDSGG